MDDERTDGNGEPIPTAPDPNCSNEPTGQPPLTIPNEPVTPEPVPTKIQAVEKRVPISRRSIVEQGMRIRELADGRLRITIGSNEITAAGLTSATTSTGAIDETHNAIVIYLGTQGWGYSGCAKLYWRGNQCWFTKTVRSELRWAVLGDATARTVGPNEFTRDIQGHFHAFRIPRREVVEDSKFKPQPADAATDKDAVNVANDRWVESNNAEKPRSPGTAQEKDSAVTEGQETDVSAESLSQRATDSYSFNGTNPEGPKPQDNTEPDQAIETTETAGPTESQKT